MAKYTLSQLNSTYELSNKTLASRIPASVSATSVNDSNDKNNGDFWGGLGYLGEKVGLGFLSGVEGIWDFAAGGIADLFGADEWAEKQFANDWVN